MLGIDPRCESDSLRDLKLGVLDSVDKFAGRVRSLLVDRGLKNEVKALGRDTRPDEFPVVGE